jgi:asparagine synthase (glutamine-hydrolysing)
MQDAIRRKDLRSIVRSSRSGRPFWDNLGWRGIRRGAAQLLLSVPGVKHKSNAVHDYCSRDVINASSADPLALEQLTFSEALYRDAERGRLGEWIWHNDRNAMMSSIENRSPLLDYRLAKFIATDATKKFVAQWNKHELRSAFDQLVKLPTQWRVQKQGFRWAARRFFKDNRSRILDLVDSSRVLRPWVRIDRFCEDARRNEQLITSRLTARMVCVAGIEHALHVASG